MSINELFKKANKLFIQNNYIDGLKIYVDVLSKYPLGVRLSEELKKTTKKYKKAINQTVTDQEISNFFEIVPKTFPPLFSVIAFASDLLMF